MHEKGPAATMKVKLEYAFARDKKEPFRAVVERIHRAFVASGLGEPSIEFRFSARPGDGPDTSVDRVMERYPELRTFLRTTEGTPGTPGTRELSNFS